MILRSRNEMAWELYVAAMSRRAGEIGFKSWTRDDFDHYAKGSFLAVDAFRSVMDDEGPKPHVVGTNGSPYR